MPPRAGSTKERPLYFAAPADLRAWLEEHHPTAAELWAGYWKKSTGKPSITWAQAVEQLLCFGWIDGVAYRIDDQCHVQRFTPRRKGSIWSAKNIAREEAKSGVYSFERKEPAALTAEQQQRFQRAPRAFAWFEAQAPSYRRAALHWVVSAKQEETRARRLAQLIADSAAERHLKHLQRRKPPAKSGGKPPAKSGAKAAKPAKPAKPAKAIKPAR
jgi:uncharacterized protein YdeI (YjbR/CyaY-like superfamily)